MHTVRIAAAQTPEFRGDIDASLRYADQVVTQAAAHGVQLICFPECFLQGYLLNEAEARRSAIDLASLEFQSLLALLPSTDMIIIFGLIERRCGSLFNSAVIIQNGALMGRYRKKNLLKSESFFASDAEMPMFEVDGLRFGVNICYDTNSPDIAKMIADQGGELIVCLANNMMPRERAEQYLHLHNAVRGERCLEQGIWLVSSDIFGERDGRISWGPTAVIDPGGQVAAQLPLDEAGLLIFDVPVSSMQRLQ
ncbi:carbon-nitrogen hydrolase family protein [Agrobacterium vitis]|uniref:carbon-nitrogen hydrolase family protein n=1 Tax=Agrobacterium vitis TaxID=373 RepID=UPI0012E8FC5E|nr:carbon-nitrogen hydrolase family protein [Agrobacterium vitis]MVA63174.1 carbon-nitrogen hydrolase family protein [Agrobacterium vitis]